MNNLMAAKKGKEKKGPAKEKAAPKESAYEILIDELKEKDVAPIVKREGKEFDPDMSDTDEHLKEEIIKYGGAGDYAFISSVSRAKGIDDVVGYTYGNVMGVKPEDKGEEFYVGAIAYHSSDKKGYGEDTHEQRIDDFEKKAHKKTGKKKVKMFVIEATDSEKKLLEKKGYVRVGKYTQPTIRREEDGSTSHKPVDNLHLMIKHEPGEEPTKEQIKAAIGTIWDHWYKRGKEGSPQYDGAAKEHEEMMKGVDKQLTNYAKKEMNK